VSLYQSIKLHWKKPEYLLMLIFIGVNIALSFGQTKEFAAAVGVQNPFHQAAFSVILEGLFAFTLLTRADQRAQNLNVPLFLNLAYFGLLVAITIVNISVLYQKNPIAGPFLGLVITGTMLYTEKLFVWKNTSSNQPARKTPHQLKKEAEKEIQEERVMQEIEYLKYEARKPSLNLIKRARKDEQKRRRVEKGQSIWPWGKDEEQELPEYFRRKKEDPIKEVIAELERSEPKTVEVEQAKTAEIVPLGGIGFHAETARRESKSERKKSPAPMFRPNQEKRQEALEVAIRLESELGRVPEPKELMEEGLTKHYATFARKELRKMRETE
jgi:hypothetical protein